MQSGLSISQENYFHPAKYFRNWLSLTAQEPADTADNKNIAAKITTPSDE